MNEEKYLDQLIEDEQKELVRSKVYEYGFQQEAADPKKMGKTQALEQLAVWQKHIRGCETRIGMYKEYLKRYV